MELFFVIVATIIIICVFVILLYLLIRTKSKKYILYFFIAFVLYVILCLFWLSTQAIKNRGDDPKNFGIMDRMHAAIEGIKDGTAFAPYDPCLHRSSYDGPGSIENAIGWRQLFYEDYIVILPKIEDKNVRYIVHPQPNDKGVFSLPKAAYALRQALKNDAMVPLQDPSKKWYVQLLGVEKIFEEPSYIFEIGSGELSSECPHFFKIQFKAAISTSCKIYLYRQDLPQYIQTSSCKNSEVITQDKDFGIDIIDFISMPEHTRIIPQ